MKLKIQWLVVVLAIGFGFSKASAQQTTNLKTTVNKIDAGEPKSGFIISLYLNGNFIKEDSTDTDGYSNIASLDPGAYKIVISKSGYESYEVIRDLSGPKNDLYLNVISKKIVTEEKTITVRGVAKSPVSLDKNERVIKNIVTSPRQGTDIITASDARVNRTAQGVSIRGSRSDANGTFIDGMRIIGGGASLPALGTESIGVYTGGIPAAYGDLTGGGFSFTTKGASPVFKSAMQMQTSTGLDPFAWNTLEGYLSGPIWKKAYKNLEGKTQKLVKLGYTLNGVVGYYKDPSPTRTGVYIVKDNVLTDLENNPLVLTPNGFIHRASYLRENDFQRLNARPNSPLANGNFVGKLEFRPNTLIDLTFYGSYFYQNGLAVTNNPMNYKVNGRSINETYRGYVRFTQNFKTNKESSIKNAFYSIRAEYQSSNGKGMDAVHGDNIFDYGYIGTFKRYPTPVFQYENYDLQQNPNKQPRTVKDQNGKTVVIRNYWEQAGFADTLMTFEASDLNKVRANYTQYVYDFYASRGVKVRNENTLLLSQGLLNGYSPGSVYSLLGTPGAPGSGYSRSQDEKYSLFAVGQMQYKPKDLGGIQRAAHDLQAGLYYEQNVSRGWGLNAPGLWQLMRQLMNKHIQELDKDNPILSYDANGIFTDTVRYNRLVNKLEQSTFDIRFRDKLVREGRTDVYGNKIDERTFVDINSYKPSDFSLNMFNADELLNNGNGYASWYGYDHLGKKVRGKPSIDQFLNDKDKRTIGAFQPVYMAAWVEDKFNFKDLVFRLGLRMERYDANQAVLKDPYSLYPVKTAGEVASLNGNPVKHPSNIGGDYAVYVDNIKAPTTILGYRNGDKWFDRFGTEIRNPQILSDGYVGQDGVQYRNSQGRIAPYLKNPNQQNITSETFKDFIPVVNLLPRIWFTFPLERGKKTFYVSYDKLAQRPNSGASFLTLDELYYLKNRQGATISNGDLKQRLKTDYEVGYKQIFGARGDRGLEIAATYSEIRNDFGLYQINQGYPVTYITYRNIDFASILGFSGGLVFDNLGGKGNTPGPMSITASYMLQFADGTGSNINAQAALIASNQPNLRNSIPLGELDIRHTLKVLASWNWDGGIDFKTKRNLYTGPVINGKEIFKFTSFTIISNTYSGAPYTATTVPAQLGVVDRAPIKGVPFGSRLPWQQTLDLNITKGFSLKRKDAEKRLLLNVFLNVTNILNTKNVVSVFRYTGSANDDGFLNSPNGQIATKNQLDAQSYVDIYKIVLNSQTGNFAAPRTIRLGLRVNFN